MELIVQTLQLKFTPDHRFNSVDFICTSAAKNAWIACRHFSSLDGTFTKTSFEYTLMMLCGYDAMDQLVVFAWALTPGEDQFTWGWFLVLAPII
jgi:hypothetical protein